MGTTRQAVPAFLRLAAHPVRWRLMTELAASDLRVRELVTLVGEPQNLVSYHLRLLRDGGLVTTVRSTFDGRDTYYHLDLERCGELLAGTGGLLHPALRPNPASAPADRRRPGVLFVCTGNSARSPIAEALLRHRSAGRADVASGGTSPKPHLHPGAVRVLHDRFGIDVSGRPTRSLADLAGRRFDVVVSLCDRAREACPAFLGAPRRVHWSIPDPATAADGNSLAFRRVATDIDTRIGHLLPVLDVA